MSVVAFNTHAFVKRLTAAGMPEAQAEALADEQVHIIDDRLATKDDIAKLEASTKSDIAKLEASMKSDIAKLEASIALLKHELTIRVGGLVMALGGFLVAIKFFGH